MRSLYKSISKWRRSCKAKKLFLKDLSAYRSMAVDDDRFDMANMEMRPCLFEREGTATFDRHYFFHLAWAARVLSENMPSRHVDISSHIHLSAIISGFIPTELVEFNPFECNLDSLTVSKGALESLPYDDQSLSSVSCMHVVEHVGLGRYGDNVDPRGDLKAFSELQRVLKSGGSLLLVVPVGRPRVLFNAHRIYSYDQIIAALPDLEIAEFSLIPESRESGDLIRNAPPSLVESQGYGCGCFLFKRN